MTVPGAADLLLSPAGQELLASLAGHDVGPDEALALSARLRGRYPADLVAAALTQQSLRVAARAKFSRAGDMLLTRDGLEQASAQDVAAHSARRYAGMDLVADLCCGIGGDTLALATAARHVLAVDADAVTLRFALANAAAYDVAGSVTPACADVRTLDMARGGRVGGVFTDPARRAGGRRLPAGRSDPPLDWCLGLAGQVAAVGIKAAPGLPRDRVPQGWEAEFVAVGRDLKEALLWSPALASAPRRATVLPATPGAAEAATMVAGPGEPVPLASPGAFLLDPSPAVTRAGLVQDLGREVGGWQLDRSTAFLSVDEPVLTPFARTLRVLESMPWHERDAARKLRELGVGAADIRRRGLAGDVLAIHRRLGLQGERAATVVLTRLQGRPWGLICEPV